MFLREPPQCAFFCLAEHVATEGLSENGEAPVERQNSLGRNSGLEQTSGQVRLTRR